MCAVAVLAALVTTPAQVFAAATEQGAPGVYVASVPRREQAVHAQGAAYHSNCLGSSCALNFVDDVMRDAQWRAGPVPSQPAADF